MGMRQDPNFILDTFIKNRKNPQKMRGFRYTYNRRSLIDTYVDSSYNFNSRGEEILERFYRFRNFLHNTGGIHGYTEGGRKFHIGYSEKMETPKYSNKLQLVTKLDVRIYEPDGSVFRPSVNFSDVMNYSILSAVNKYEGKFFDGIPGRVFKRTKNNDIVVKGLYNNKAFKMDISICDSEIEGEFYFLEMGKYTNDISFLQLEIPPHIPKDQKHRYIVRSFCNESIVKEQIFKLIKNSHTKCCGISVSANDRFCRSCGKEFQCGELEITEIDETLSEVLLT
jgi:hypothetical protein